MALRLDPDPTKTKVQTRDGRHAEIYAVKEGMNHPILGAILGPDNQWRLCQWAIDGRIYRNCGECVTDLINAPAEPVTATRWVNVYPYGPDLSTHLSKTDAECFAGAGRIACVPIQITYRPGEGI